MKIILCNSLLKQFTQRINKIKILNEILEAKLVMTFIELTEFICALHLPETISKQTDLTSAVIVYSRKMKRHQSK